MKELLKNKKLIIWVSVVLLVLMSAAILSFTVFTVKTINVEFKNVPNIFTEESKDNIWQNSSLKKGTSIFTLNKSKLSHELELDNPYIKIVNIETQFPNKIIIHCAEREETYAVKYGESKYFICDAEFKVLSIKTSFKNDSDNPILFLGIENLIENKSRANIGDFLSFSSEVKILKNLGTALLQCNKTVVDQRALIKSIEMDSEIYYYTSKNQPYFKITDHNGFLTKIYALDTQLAAKLQYMFASISEVIYNPEVFFTPEELASMDLTDFYYLNYNLKIEENNKSEIIIRLTKIA